MKITFTITDPQVGRHRGFTNNPTKRKEWDDARKKCMKDIINFLKICGYKTILSDNGSKLAFADKNKDMIPFSLGESFVIIGNRHYRSTIKMQLYYNKPLDLEKYKAKAIEILNDYTKHLAEERKSENTKDAMLKIASKMINELDKKKIETDFDINDDNDLVFTHKVTHKSGDTSWLFNLTFKQNGAIHFRISEDNDDFLKMMYKGINITDYLNAEIFPSFFKDVDESRGKLVEYMKVAETIKSVYLKITKN